MRNLFFYCSEELLGMRAVPLIRNLYEITKQRSNLRAHARVDMYVSIRFCHQEAF